MLIMENVSYSYKSSRSKCDVSVLSGLSLEFKPGVFYTLFGPSGAGKTTCLSLLGGLDTPDSGVITLDGVDIREIGYNELRKRHVSYVFQDFHLFTYMTAMENVLLAMKLSGQRGRKSELRQKAVSLLSALGLSDQEMNRIVTKLSGGQQQRVAIARALSTDAQYIFADEPTGNLDKENTALIIQLLRELVATRGKCVIAVTHSEQVKSHSDICYSLEG